MHPYLPHTESDKRGMLDFLGLESMEDLFKDIPEELLLNRPLNIPVASSERQVLGSLKQLSRMNDNTEDLICFLGAGAYDHYIPSTIDPVLSRSEFYTAYTPYQPEVSQGTLQVIFEYQSMITELTGMDVSNASLYDGATAAAEAVFMACGQTRRKKVILSDTIHPMVLKVIQTYAAYKDITCILIREEEGVTPVKELLKVIDKEVACAVIQTPNFYGNVEELAEIADALHKVKALLIASVDPISLGIYKTPGDFGADIVVGEGQSLGLPLNFGGPYLGFIACTKKYMRKLPGRIVGETTDVHGKRAFVLTLQAREQHIRREKATSNITSNQALMALAATVYMATMGKEGLKEVATQSLKKAHYLAEGLEKIQGVQLRYNQPFFKEFVVTLPEQVSVESVQRNLQEKGYLIGLPLGFMGEDYKRCLLICATENRTLDEIDNFLKDLEVAL